MRASVAPRSARELALLFALKAAVGAWVLAIGFTHVSDDDYARIVIAQTFAHTPKLDPSGTSWLPFPFWIYGAAMAVFGPSLATARVVAFVLGVVGTAPPYLALRAVGVGRTASFLGVALAMALPWSAWTAVAPIPESLTAGLIAAAAVATARAELAGFAAACAFAASLSRYEAWPVCAVVALLALARGRRVGAAALASAGPLLWIAWNLHAHGDPLHFLARVAAFRQASGAAAIPLTEKIFGYPKALVEGAPLMMALTAVAALALASGDVRARWTAPLAIAGATLAFLVLGDVRDGAPTHHPERALLGVWWILAAFVADAGREAAMRAARVAPAALVWGLCAGAAAACLGVSARNWPDFPGRGADDRTAQIARGYALKARGAEKLEIVPCAYEHFALLAAFGHSEDAKIAPTTRQPVTDICPRVREN